MGGGNHQFLAERTRSARGPNLAKSNGKNPRADKHFKSWVPRWGHDSTAEGIEGKKWLPSGSALRSKRSSHTGGDGYHLPVHQLDIWRKHVRMISAQPEHPRLCWTSATMRVPSNGGGPGGIDCRVLEIKQSGIVPKPPTASNRRREITASARYSVQRTRLLRLVNKESSPVLLHFATRVAEISLSGLRGGSAACMPASREHR